MSEGNKQNAVCPWFGSCGGCAYGGISYAEQLEKKEAEMKALFLPVLGEDFFADGRYEGITGSPTAEAYRNKMEFSFGNEKKDGPLCLGLHKKGRFFDVMSVPGCRNVHSDFTRITEAVQAYFREKGLPFYHKMSHQGILRHLVVRRSETGGELLVNLVTTSAYVPEPDFAELLTGLPLEGSLAGILHTQNDALSDAIIPEKVTLLYGRGELNETVLGLKFRISPFSFFQTNTCGAEILYERAREYIGDIAGSTVYDLYSGTGTIAQVLSPAAGRVIGVEIVEEAVEAARENAACNGLSNCEFLAGDVLKVLDDLSGAPDYIILDPPRDGVNPKALSKILRREAGRMVYISCKPKSLARDLPMMELAGYRAERLSLVDMFPNTNNVEAICLLVRKDAENLPEASGNAE